MTKDKELKKGHKWLRDMEGFGSGTKSIKRVKLSRIHNDKEKRIKKTREKNGRCEEKDQEQKVSKGWR